MNKSQNDLLKTIELADCVYSISGFSRDDYESYFNRTSSMEVIHHGTNLRTISGSSSSTAWEWIRPIDGKRICPQRRSGGFEASGCWGALSRSAEIILRQMSRSMFVGLQAGHYQKNEMQRLFEDASVLVYPSHYEGYGLPVIDSLAFGKPVVALDTAVNREILATVQDRNFVLVKSYEDLRQTVEEILSRNLQKNIVGERRSSGQMFAGEYVASFQRLLNKPPNADKLRKRQQLFLVLDSSSHA